MAKKGIRRETRRVRVESDGSIWNTRITDAETGEEITPVYRVVWEADA